MTDRDKFEYWFASSGDEDVPGWVEQGLWQAWQAALASQQPADDGWIEWEDGDCPLDDLTVVYLRFRDGTETNLPRPAFCYSWTRDTITPHCDIVAYRVVKP